MLDDNIVLPLIIIFASALVAALSGLPSFNRRLTTTQLSGLLALAPLTAFGFLLSYLPALQTNLVFIWKIRWLPSMGFDAVFYLDSLSCLFALLITFIGTLIVIYAGKYFKGDPSAWRFFTFILLFMGTMLGLVMAGDILTLFIFWEGTSIVSFLLIAHKYNDQDARRGAFKALMITGGGGIVLLIGLLLVAFTVGNAGFVAILDCGDLLRSSPLYPAMLVLIAIGAFTKSAQFPAHIWLPDAMSAPTPASAYLHSATMVKAGIYLMARLNPVLGQTELWFWLLSLTGMVTMLIGAYQGLRQNDLKALLAYSTISQLGILMMMIGQDMQIAFKALVIGILAHALYKSALFLVVGIVDHETGTRDLRSLGGLRRSMPYTFYIGAIAALSMAGLPPLFGFLAKETLLAAAFHPSLPGWVSWIFTLASIMTGALMFTLAAILIWDTFMGKTRDKAVKGQEAPVSMLCAPAIPAFLSLALGQLPGPKQEAALLANAASAAHGAKVKVSLALWTGLNIPLVMSAIAIAIGLALFFNRSRVRKLQQQIGVKLSLNAVYGAVLKAIDRGAYLATRLQQGKLRTYLAVILAGTAALFAGFGGLSLPLNWSALTWPAFDFSGELVILRVFILLVIVGSALASVLLRNDLFAIIALTASGLGVAVLMLLEPAPDLALVQIVVDILSVVILVLALTRLPRRQRERAHALTFKQSPFNLVRDGLVAAAGGITVMLATLSALTSRPRQSMVTPFYVQNAKPVVGSKSIVGAIITDFRGLDTLIEISVFSMAGLGIYTLLRYAARKFGDSCSQLDDLTPPNVYSPATFGIGGSKTSPFIRLLAYIALPVAMVIGATNIMYGHDHPGDGFTAGVIVGLAVSFWYVVFGYDETRQRLNWLKGTPLVAAGILLAIAAGTAAAFVNGTFFSNADFGHLLGLPLPKGFHLSSSFLFELAICLSVLGSVTHMLAALGRPSERDAESNECFLKLSETEVKK